MLPPFLPPGSPAPLSGFHQRPPAGSDTAHPGMPAPRPDGPLVEPQPGL